MRKEEMRYGRNLPPCMKVDETSPEGVNVRILSRLLGGECGSEGKSGYATHRYLGTSKRSTYPRDTDVVSEARENCPKRRPASISSSASSLRRRSSLGDAYPDACRLSCRQVSTTLHQPSCRRYNGHL